MPGIGSPAPDFSGTDIVKGDTFTLSNHAREVVLVCFMSHL